MWVFYFTICTFVCPRLTFLHDLSVDMIIFKNLLCDFGRAQVDVIALLLLGLMNVPPDKSTLCELLTVYSCTVDVLHPFQCTRHSIDRQTAAADAHCLLVRSLLCVTLYRHSRIKVCLPLHYETSAIGILWFTTALAVYKSCCTIQVHMRSGGARDFRRGWGHIELI